MKSSTTKSRAGPHPSSSDRAPAGSPPSLDPGVDQEEHLLDTLLHGVLQDLKDENLPMSERTATSIAELKAEQGLPPETDALYQELLARGLKKA